jgi:hypothetical protein
VISRAEKWRRQLLTSSYKFAAVRGGKYIFGGNPVRNISFPGQRPRKINFNPQNEFVLVRISSYKFALAYDAASFRRTQLLGALTNQIGR